MMMASGDDKQPYLS